MQEFISNHGIQIIINDGGDVYLKGDIDSDTDIELTFDSVEKTEKVFDCSIEDISIEDMINYQNELEDFPDIELEEFE